MSTNTETFQCPCIQSDTSGGHQTVCVHTNELGYPAALTFNPNQLDSERLTSDRLRSMDALDLLALGCADQGKVHVTGTAIKEAIQARAHETPWPAFRFAMEYDHLDIADAAAPHTIGRLPTKEQCIHDLPLADQLAWYKYREQYLLLLDAVFAQPAPHKNTKRKLHDCGGWDDYANYVLGDLPTMSLFTIMDKVAEHGASALFGRGRWEKEIIPPGWDEECVTCRERADKWENSVNRRFRKLETFGTILERVRLGSGNG